MGHLYHCYVSHNERVNHHCSRLNRSQWKKSNPIVGVFSSQDSSWSPRWQAIPNTPQRAAPSSYPQWGWQKNSGYTTCITWNPDETWKRNRPRPSMTLELKSCRAQFIEINCAWLCLYRYVHITHPYFTHSELTRELNGWTIKPLLKTENKRIQHGQRHCTAVYQKSLNVLDWQGKSLKTWNPTNEYLGYGCQNLPVCFSRNSTGWYVFVSQLSRKPAIILLKTTKGLLAQLEAKGGHRLIAIPSTASLNKDSPVQGQKNVGLSSSNRIAKDIVSECSQPSKLYIKTICTEKQFTIGIELDMSSAPQTYFNSAATSWAQGPARLP